MNIFMQLIKSNYSPKDIARFRFQGIGKTILYVFLLTLVSVIPSMYFLNTSIIEGISTAKEKVEKEFPSFTIENGRLETVENTPVTLEDDGFFFVLDSTGEIEADDLSENENAVGLLEKEFVLVSAGQIQSYPYTIAEDFTLTKDELVEFIDVIDSSLPIILPVLSLVIYIFSSGMEFIEVSILGFFGMLIISASGRNMKYGQIWRIAAYSVTLPTIFFTIMSALNTVVPYGFLIHWAVAYIILYLAIKEVPQVKKS